MQYDGTGKLAEAIAELCKVSVKNQVKIASLIKQAKTELGITSKAKQLPDDMKLNIWRWHYDRLNPVYNVKQDEGIQVDDEKPAPDNPVYDFKQLHFAVTIAHSGKVKRTTVMLEGYLMKALQRKQGLSDNAAVRVWIEQAIEGDDRFDSSAPLTRQVKRIIIESLVVD